MQRIQIGMQIQQAIRQKAVDSQSVNIAKLLYESRGVRRLPEIIGSCRMSKIGEIKDAKGKIVNDLEDITEMV